MAVGEEEPVNAWQYFLWIVFGIGSWLAVNGVYAELPFMAESLPEGYSIAATLGVAIQMGNLGPLVYTFLHRRYGNKISRVATLAVFLIGIVCCVLLSFLWDKTAKLPNGKQASVPLIALTAGLAVVDCTSSVVFWPFAASFPAIYVTALATGEMLSGTVPGLISLVQAANKGGVCASGGKGLFDPSVFFVILAITMLSSGIAYRCLSRLEQERLQRQTIDTLDVDVPTPSYEKIRGRSNSEEMEYDDTLAQHSTSRTLEIQVNGKGLAAVVAAGGDEDGDDGGGDGEHKHQHHARQTEPSPDVDVLEVYGPRVTWRVYVVIAFLGSLQNGILPTLIPLACNIYTPCTYGVTNSAAFSLAPLFALIAARYPLQSEGTTVALSLIILGLACYIFALACLDQSAPMAGTGFGGAVHGVVIVATFVGAAYVKSAAFWIVREGHEHAEPKTCNVSYAEPHTATDEHLVSPSSSSSPRPPSSSLPPSSSSYEHLPPQPEVDEAPAEYSQHRLWKAGSYMQLGSAIGAFGIFIVVTWTKWLPSQ
uniref:Uncharacterized protein n=1 Tax=Lotharella oceanica TaxID=641309 RepID=A0A7S2TSP4_9EUKA|mmetsp:Transcript_28246/g.52765  ORF Transcript_28246/g.52765 Transcript_28246/m.52765 type:complete len:538 (+) Transcript_28246:67-1680(+)